MSLIDGGITENVNVRVIWKIGQRAQCFGAFGSCAICGPEPGCVVASHTMPPAVPYGGAALCTHHARHGN